MNPDRKIIFSIYGKFAAFIFFATYIMILHGCGYVNKYSMAQDYFNEASQAEIRQRFIPGPNINGENALIDTNRIRSNYSLANKLITEIIRENEGDLKKDNLFGNALAIKSICEWKLGMYTEADNSAKIALKLTADVLFPRDRALMIAMPGLIKTDQAYFHSRKPTPDKKYEEIEKMIIGTNGAINDFKNAILAVDDKHPVRIYLQMSELAALRTLQVAVEKMVGDENARKEKRNDLRDKHIKPVLDEFNNTLKSTGLEGHEEWKQARSYWEALLGM